MLPFHIGVACEGAMKPALASNSALNKFKGELFVCMT